MLITFYKSDIMARDMSNPRHFITANFYTIFFFFFFFKIEALSHLDRSL